MEEPRPQRKLHRLKGYDYSQNGAYFVTICTKNRAPLLCRVGNAVPGVPPPVAPTPIGKLVLAAWEKLGKLDPGIHTDAFCLMPNHIHGIIFLDYSDSTSDAEGRGRRSLPDGVCTSDAERRGRRSLPDGVCASDAERRGRRSLPDGVCVSEPERRGRRSLPGGVCASEPERRPRRSLPEIVRGFKSVTTREYNRLVPAEKNNTLWQGSYYDTVLRSEAHYLTVRQYIDENPIRWTEDEYFTPPEP